MFRWNATAGNWDFYVADIEYGDDFPIEPGKSYLLNSTTASTWTVRGN